MKASRRCAIVALEVGHRAWFPGTLCAALAGTLLFAAQAALAVTVQEERIDSCGAFLPVFLAETPPRPEDPKRPPSLKELQAAVLKLQLRCKDKVYVAEALRIAKELTLAKTALDASGCLGFEEQQPKKKQDGGISDTWSAIGHQSVIIRKQSTSKLGPGIRDLMPPPPEQLKKPDPCQAVQNMSTTLTELRTASNSLQLSLDVLSRYLTRVADARRKTPPEINKPNSKPNSPIPTFADLLLFFDGQEEKPPQPNPTSTPSSKEGNPEPVAVVPSTPKARPQSEEPKTRPAEPIAEPIKEMPPSVDGFPRKREALDRILEAMGLPLEMNGKNISELLRKLGATVSSNEKDPAVIKVTFPHLDLSIETDARGGLTVKGKEREIYQNDLTLEKHYLVKGEMIFQVVKDPKTGARTYDFYNDKGYPLGKDFDAELAPDLKRLDIFEIDKTSGKRTLVKWLLSDGKQMIGGSMELKSRLGFAEIVGGSVHRYLFKSEELRRAVADGKKGFLEDLEAPKCYDGSALPEPVPVLDPLRRQQLETLLLALPNHYLSSGKDKQKPAYPTKLFLGDELEISEFEVIFDKSQWFIRIQFGKNGTGPDSSRRNQAFERWVLHWAEKKEKGVCEYPPCLKAFVFDERESPNGATPARFLVLDQYHPDSSADRSYNQISWFNVTAQSDNSLPEFNSQTWRIYRNYRGPEWYMEDNYPSDAPGAPSFVSHFFEATSGGLQLLFSPVQSAIYETEAFIWEAGAMVARDLNGKTSFKTDMVQLSAVYTRSQETLRNLKGTWSGTGPSREDALKVYREAMENVEDRRMMEMYLDDVYAQSEKKKLGAYSQVYQYLNDAKASEDDKEFRRALMASTLFGFGNMASLYYKMGVETGKSRYFLAAFMVVAGDSYLTGAGFSVLSSVARIQLAAKMTKYPVKGVEEVLKKAGAGAELSEAEQTVFKTYNILQTAETFAMLAPQGFQIGKLLIELSQTPEDADLQEALFHSLSGFGGMLVSPITTGTAARLIQKFRMPQAKATNAPDALVDLCKVLLLNNKNGKKIKLSDDDLALVHFLKESGIQIQIQQSETTAIRGAKQEPLMIDANVIINLAKDYQRDGAITDPKAIKILDMIVVKRGEGMELSVPIQVVIEVLRETSRGGKIDSQSVGQNAFLLQLKKLGLSVPKIEEVVKFSKDAENISKISAIVGEFAQTTIKETGKATPHASGDAEILADLLLHRRSMLTGDKKFIGEYWQQIVPRWEEFRARVREATGGKEKGVDLGERPETRLDHVDRMGETGLYGNQGLEMLMAARTEKGPQSPRTEAELKKEGVLYGKHFSEVQGARLNAAKKLSPEALVHHWPQELKDKAKNVWDEAQNVALGKKKSPVSSEDIQRAYREGTLSEMPGAPSIQDANDCALHALASLISEATGKSVKPSALNIPKALAAEIGEKGVTPSLLLTLADTVAGTRGLKPRLLKPIEMFVRAESGHGFFAVVQTGDGAHAVFVQGLVRGPKEGLSYFQVWDSNTGRVTWIKTDDFAQIQMFKAFALEKSGEKNRTSDDWAFLKDNIEEKNSTVKGKGVKLPQSKDAIVEMKPWEANRDRAVELAWIIENSDILKDLGNRHTQEAVLDYIRRQGLKYDGREFFSDDPAMAYMLNRVRDLYESMPDEGTKLKGLGLNRVLKTFIKEVQFKDGKKGFVKFAHPTEIKQAEVASEVKLPPEYDNVALAKVRKLDVTADNIDSLPQVKEMYRLKPYQELFLKGDSAEKVDPNKQMELLATEAVGEMSLEEAVTQNVKFSRGELDKFSAAVLYLAEKHHVYFLDIHTNNIRVRSENGKNRFYIFDWGAPSAETVIRLKEAQRLLTPGSFREGPVGDSQKRNAEFQHNMLITGIRTALEDLKLDLQTRAPSPVDARR